MSSRIKLSGLNLHTGLWLFKLMLSFSIVLFDQTDIHCYTQLLSFYCLICFGDLILVSVTFNGLRGTFVPLWWFNVHSLVEMYIWSHSSLPAGLSLHQKNYQVTKILRSVDLCCSFLWNEPLSGIREMNYLGSFQSINQSPTIGHHSTNLLKIN